MEPFIEILLWILSIFVVPIVLDKSDQHGHFDFLHGRLRETWAIILGLYWLCLMWIEKETFMAARTRFTGWKSYLAVAGIFAVIGCVIWALTGLFMRSPAKVEKRDTGMTRTNPSFVFVFGAPLGDNESASWIMMLKHYGPSPAYNCDIIFYDNDRKNIEHRWLVKHPNSPYPPPGLAGQSQKSIHLAEAGPDGSLGSFTWNPINPNSQHYTVSISCRDGVFVEKWEVTRVNGILRCAITVEHGPPWIKKNPAQNPVVFRCEDPEFIGASLATELPKSSPGKAVHPGWKPLHRFEVPAAIIDPTVMYR